MFVYLLIINAFAFCFMLADKQFARRHRRRISEAALLLPAFLGGSAGALAGMLLFHHKTKKPKFTVTVPLLLVFHVLLLIVFCP